MLNLLYKIYFLRFKSMFIDSSHIRIITRLTNILLPFCWLTYRKKKHKLKHVDNPNFIVSLTTFPKRIDKVWLTIESILRQIDKPDKIILWLYDGEFDGYDSLPKSLQKQQKRGLDIRFCSENLMPHKKYLYTIKEYPHANVITIDDDWFYPSDLISKLKKYNKIYPDSILCPYTREIKIVDHELLPYKKWGKVSENSSPTFRLLTMGGGGTLFPPKALHNDVFDIDLIKKLSLTADDLWLKIQSIRNGTKVVSIAGEYTRFFMFTIIKDNILLTKTNIVEGKNNEIFNALIEYYKIPLNLFKD